MRCTNCGFGQSSKGFCEKCGTLLFVEKQREVYWEEKIARKEASMKKASQMVFSTEHTHEEKNDQKTKGIISYLEFLKHYFTRPAQVLAMKIDLNKYGMISLFLFILLFPLSFALLTRHFFGIVLRTPPGGLEIFQPGKPAYIGPSFFTIFGYAFLTVVAIIVISLTLFYLIRLVSGLSLSIRELTGIYGAHLNPSIAIVVFSIPFIMVKAFILGYYMLAVSVILLVFALPVYYIVNLLTREAERQKRLFHALLVSIVCILTFVVILTPIGQEIIRELSNPYW